MKKTIIFKYAGALFLFYAFSLCFTSLKIIAAEEKQKLILLPVSGENISTSDRVYYEAAIKKSLYDRYKIFSGEKVVAALSKTDDEACTTDECLEYIAATFDGELVASCTVDRKKTDNFIKIEIKNAFNRSSIYKNFDSWSGGSRMYIAAKLKGMAKGPENAGKGIVTQDSRTVEGKKLSDTASLSIDSMPSGATVYLGGAVVGKTPYRCLKLKAGKVIVVSLKKDGYYVESVELELSKGMNDLGRIGLLSRIGALSVTTDPEGADVFLGGIKVGKTPYVNKKMKAGEYLLSLERELYHPVKNHKIGIDDEKTTEKHFELKSEFGGIEVATTPSFANVTITGKNNSVIHKDVSPFSIDLNPGTYEVKIERYLYKSINYTVNVTDKKKEVISAEKAVLRRYGKNITEGSEQNEKGAGAVVDGTVMSHTEDCGAIAADVKLKDGGKSISNDLGMKFVWIRPGTFMMGSPEEENGRIDNENIHKVTLTKGFYMQTTEVTQGQWKKVMGDNPSRFSNCGDNCPVENVSWNDVKEFIKKINRMDRKRIYRLPTEAEWEYACSAGTTTPFSFGNCLSTDQANYDGNYPLKGCPKGKYREKPVPVGSFPPNAWGLYDMHGNVQEWCEDWFYYYQSGSVTDPVGPSSAPARVCRGGSWSETASTCRSASRSGSLPNYRNINLGFRLVCLQAGQ